VFPIRVLDPDQAQDLRRRFEALVEWVAARTAGPTNIRPHLLLKWADDLIRDPRVLDPVESVLGPNILCWASGFFAKSPGDGRYVSWHQDATHWSLSSDEAVTAWIALTPSTQETGCLRVVPGSHRTRFAHRDTFAGGNMLSRGQEIAVDVDEAQAVDVVLQPGEMSLHHALLCHGSNPNRGGDWRIGLTVRYVPTHLKKLAPVRSTATLVRGIDAYGHFEPEQRPRADFAPEAVAYHDAIQARSNGAGDRDAQPTAAM
jgi:hypothetical protein